MVLPTREGAAIHFAFSSKHMSVLNWSRNHAIANNETVELQDLVLD